ncbi:MAG: amidohydrolase family protein, partial [Erythrobacter sp.]|nr:amidohydrolase family protein [Erythrobacter sp.]
MSHDLRLSEDERLDGKLTVLSAGHSPVLIQGGVVLDGRGGRIDGGTILVENMRVAQVGSNLAEHPQDVRVIDAGGATVLPGLIDLHIHFMGRNVSEPTLDHLHPSHDMKFIRAAFEFGQTLASGVTTVRA